MQLLAVDLALLRDVLLPGLTLTPGRAVMARVVTPDDGSGGTLAIAGFLLDAELPHELSAGESLRLVVRDVSADRVLLGVATEPPPQPLAPPATAVSLPAGGRLRVLEDGGESSTGGGGAPASHTLGLQLDLPALGTLELRFTLDPATVRATIAARAGEPVQEAQAAADELRDALAEAAQRPSIVTVTTRREPLEVYA